VRDGNGEKCEGRIGTSRPDARLRYRVRGHDSDLKTGLLLCIGDPH